MTLVARFTAEGGTAGQPVAAGGAGSGNAWDSVVNTSNVITYDATHVDYGSLAIRVAMLSAVCRVAWSSATLGTRSELYYAGDFYFTGSPTSSCHFVEGVTSGAAQAWAVDIASTGKFFVRNSANTNIYTSTNSVPVNQYVRFEVHYIAGNPGTLQVRLYAGYQDTVALEDTGALSTSTGSDQSSLYVGALTSSTAMPQFWAGDQRVGDAAGSWLGPGSATYSGAATMVSETSLGGSATSNPSGGAAMVSSTSLVPVAVATLQAAATMVSATSLGGALASPIAARLLDGLTTWVAHRNGYWATLGQGTLEGYQAAVAQYSKAFLELPVRQCSTGEWVVIHDAKTDPAFSGPSATISATSWAVLSGYRSAAGNNPMRRLTDILDAFPGSMFVVDNKQDTNHADLIAVLEAHATGHWMGKAWYTASATWLAACQNAGAPVWLFFYPADLGQLPTPLTNLDPAKSLILYGLGDYSAAPVPTQADADQFWAFTSTHGIAAWADIINSAAQRTTADGQAASGGSQFAGYMVSNFAAVAPTDSLTATMTSATVLTGSASAGLPESATMTSATELTAGPTLSVPLAGAMTTATALDAAAGLQSPAASAMVSATALAGFTSGQQPAGGTLTSQTELAGLGAPEGIADAGMVTASVLSGALQFGLDMTAALVAVTALASAQPAGLLTGVPAVMTSGTALGAATSPAGSTDLHTEAGPAVIRQQSGPATLAWATGPATVA